MELCVTLLEDRNFKISLTTLEIVSTMVDKFGALLSGGPSSLRPFRLSLCAGFHA